MYSHARACLSAHPLKAQRMLSTYSTVTFLGDRPTNRSPASPTAVTPALAVCPQRHQHTISLAPPTHARTQHRYGTARTPAGALCDTSPLHLRCACRWKRELAREDAALARHMSPAAEATSMKSALHGDALPWSSTMICTTSFAAGVLLGVGAAVACGGLRVSAR